MNRLDGVASLLGGARRAANATDALLIVSVPAPATELEPRFGDLFWSSRELSVVARGAAATIEASGPERFDRVAESARALFARVQSVALDAGALSPRLFGGFSFFPEPPAAPWGAFGAASFVLPRLCWVREGDRSWVTRVIDAHELADPAARDAALDEIARALEPPTATSERPSPVLAPSAPDAAFVKLVERALREIEAGSFTKVVAARSRTLRANGIDPARVLALLGRDALSSTRYAFRRGADVFAGATPERLVSKRGARVACDALAGSCRAGDARAVEALIASDKERAEHAIVRDDIARRLGAFGSVVHPPEPDVLALKHVSHLHTPIRARVRPDLHILKIIEELHPTPAVGGHPRARALEFVRMHEPIERGWYASPVGWFDRDGDGDFAVALRSGLFSGGAAELFAGAGIVAGSDPERELAETELKLAALGSAIAGAGA